MAPSSSQVAASSESLSLGPAWPRQLSWTPCRGRSGCVCPGSVCWGPVPSALSLQSRTAVSASGFTAPESQADERRRKQMVGLKSLFSRLDRKESFHTGSVCFRSFVLRRGKHTSQIEARTGSRFWPRPLKRRADGSGSGFQRPWAGRRCPLTFHVTSLGAASRAFAFLSAGRWASQLRLCSAAVWHVPPSSFQVCRASGEPRRGCCLLPSLLPCVSSVTRIFMWVNPCGRNRVLLYNPSC